MATERETRVYDRIDAPVTPQPRAAAGARRAPAPTAGAVGGGSLGGGGGGRTERRHYSRHNAWMGNLGTWERAPRPAPRAAAPAQRALAPNNYAERDQAHAGPPDPRRPVGDWAPHERAGAGISRVVKTAPGTYTDAPDAQGDVRYYSMGGNRVDRADPIARGTTTRNTPVREYFRQLNAAPPMDGNQAYGNARRDLARYGTPAQQRAAALARGEKIEKTPEQRIADARMYKALAEEEGGASRAGMQQTLENAAMQEAADAPILAFERMLLDRHVPPDVARMEALAWGLNNNIGLRDSRVGQAAEAEMAQTMAELFNNQTRRSSFGLDRTTIPAGLAATATPRGLTGFERASKAWRALGQYSVPGLLGFDVGGLPWDTSTAYEVEGPEERTLTAYPDARTAALTETLNRLKSRGRQE